MKRGFTLVEMLVVIGIIAILIGASMVGFTKMMKSADRAKGQELVSEVATALTALYDKDGCWPKKIREMAQTTDPMLDADTALVLGKRNLISLTVNKEDKLGGVDSLGIVTPWARKVIERKNGAATEGDMVGSVPLRAHILRFAVDLDGNGYTKIPESSGDATYVRATAIVWSCDKDGKGGAATDRESIKSWTHGQETDKEE